MQDADVRRSSLCLFEIRTTPGKIPTAGVDRLVAQDFGMDAEVLYRRTRGSPREALARQVAMYLHHVVDASSFQTIGKMFGRDRTTVAHACRVIEDRRDDACFDRRLSVLETACRGLSDATSLSASVNGRAA